VLCGGVAGMCGYKGYRWNRTDTLIVQQSNKSTRGLPIVDSYEYL